VTRHVRTAYVWHENALKGNRSLGEELGWGARLDQAPDLQGAIAAMGLTGLEAVPVRVLSAGQKRRATLARAVASGSRLWLLDEPGAGLDAASVERLEQAIARHREAGGAAVIASHGETRVAGARTLSL
jgi:heme exporter protein A